MRKVTILIPCYNEEACLNKLYTALADLMQQNNSYAWEILFINDGSTDHTLTTIKQLRKKDNRICYINLSRNFGKENAMLAGFDNASGDCVVIMDADLQHPPHIIPLMLKKWEEGYDDVYGKRKTRGKESFLRKRISLLYYKVLQHSTRYDILENVGDFRLLDRKCITELQKLRETERYTKGMYAWIGFKKIGVEFETQDRVEGKSHMSIRSLLSLATDGITSFTVSPLKWSMVVGMFFSVVAFMFLIYTLIHTWIYGDPVQGYPTILTVILFLGGIQLLSLGIIGVYLGKVFNEIKHRPVYVVAEKELATPYNHTPSSHSKASTKQ
ncbi:glycosyltransferase, group 2 family protein [Prevotella amnii CRIS 21A-A]|uniref:Glycosyltransferase, group 2 family protein n=1 Tax=Prevotella amnii CRIS 21A-A TaxID=679191 RepID=E1GTZ2_9BACT|nr:glycosyltransferase family 2 protein [Prevotella amnii]EFN91826.1 glycosyltransferase, group 2 family protein [Prevotella amnii CRIS 21A-A]